MLKALVALTILLQAAWLAIVAAGALLILSWFVSQPWSETAIATCCLLAVLPLLKPATRR